MQPRQVSRIHTVPCLGLSQSLTLCTAYSFKNASSAIFRSSASSRKSAATMNPLMNLNAADNVAFRQRYSFNSTELFPRPAVAADLALANGRIDRMQAIGDALLAAVGNLTAQQAAMLNQQAAMVNQQAAMANQQAVMLDAINGVRQQVTGLAGDVARLDGKVSELDGRVTRVAADLEEVKANTSTSMRILLVFFGGLQIFFGWKDGDNNTREQARMFGAGLTRALAWVKSFFIAA